MELGKLTTDLVMAEMSWQEPEWELKWADQRDLQDAMRKPPGEWKAFLQQRAQDKVLLAVRSAYVLTVKGGA